MAKRTKFPKTLILSLKASPICLTISPRLGAGTYKKKAKKNYLLKSSLSESCILCLTHTMYISGHKIVVCGFF